MEEKTQDTLERIQQSALDEFSEKGFLGASLRQIVKHAGVTTGAFYGYFSSKEALFHYGEIYGSADQLFRAAGRRTGGPHGSGVRRLYKLDGGLHLPAQGTGQAIAVPFGRDFL